MDLSKQIQNYITNRLSKEEKLSFESKLANDTEVQNEYQEHLAIQESIAQHERGLLKANLRNLRQQQQKNQTAKKLFLFLILLALLSSFAYYWWSNQVTQSMPVQELAEAYPNVIHPVTRSNPDDQYNQAFWYYEAEQYATAADQFAFLLENQKEEGLQFYYAMSLFNSGQYSLAQKELEVLNELQSKEFSSEIKWYLGLTYHQTNQQQKATEILLTLQKIDPAFQIDKVNALLQRLEK